MEAGVNLGAMHADERDFDREAAEWDDVASRVQVAEAVARCIAGHVPLRTGMRALDCGCGTGLVTLRLAPHVASILAVDRAAGMVTALRRKVEQGAIGNVVVRQADFENDLLDDPFDLVVCTQTLAHVRDRRRALGILGRLVAPDGWLVVSEMDLVNGAADPAQATHEACRALVADAGVAMRGFWVALVLPDRTPESPGRQKRYYVLAAQAAGGAGEPLRDR